MNGHSFRERLIPVHMMASAILLTLAACALGQALPSAAQAETFSDPGFTTEVVTTHPPYKPVGVTWASDGRMFIWQRNGVIRIYKNGQLLATPFMDLSPQVNIYDDRGLLGLALHPNFLVNGYVYVSYVYENAGNSNDSSPKTGRLSRFTANPLNSDVVLANSEMVLLTIPNEYHHHSNGTLRFGSDGRLFMGHGEDTPANFVDGRALVAQDLTDLRGKILRVNEDGTAPGDNPFDDGTNSIKSKVYSYGLRNPFRFTLHPVSGEPYIGDVGWNNWEEFNRGRGKNFGWPCYEGVTPQPDYYAAFPDECAAFTPAAPLLSYPHSGTPSATGAPIIGNTALGGPFYTATLYPEMYRGNWFVVDYAQGWINRLVFDGAGTLTSTVPFATGLAGPVDLELGPDGMLYYVSITTGQVKRIRYNGPSAVATATPSSGLSPLLVNFSSAGSSDPNAGPLTYLWDFGDGQTSLEANPVHTYVAATVKTFTATLTVTSTTSQSALATVKVTVGSLPPAATIQLPLNGIPVTPGQTIAYQGSAIDPEDGVIAATGLSWIILLHHNDHTHTQLFTTGSTGSVVIQDHGIGVYAYEFQLTATDSSGLTQTISVTRPVQGGDTTPPSDPASLGATPAAGEINLSWTASTDSGGSGLAGYKVERCQGAGCTVFMQIAISSANSYNDPSLLPGTSYSYRVRAVDGAGNPSLNYSNLASATPSAVTHFVMAYGMNEGSGIMLADAWGNGHTGTLINDPTWVASQAAYGQALSFDGLDDAVSVANPNSLNLGTSDFTIELWVKRNVLGGGQRHLLSKCPAAAWVTGCKELYFNASNRLTFGSFATGDTFSSLIADTNWHHVGVTFADATNVLSIYVDGVLVTTATKALEADGAGHVVTLGNLRGANPFSGVLDEVRFYSRVLTLAEIQADMATPVESAGPDTTPPSDVTGLTATPIGATQIDLHWNAATDQTGVTGYVVERCLGAGCTTFVQIAAPVSVNYSDAGLTANTSYSYRVRAMDAASNVGGYSNIVSVSTTVLTTLVTTYGMNEGSGTMLVDASGSGHTGLLVNGPAWVAGQATYGQALSFDGLDDAVSVANSNSVNLGTSDFTIELWVKRNALGGGQRHLFSKCHSTLWQSGCKELYFKGNNQLTFGSFGTGDTSAGIIADTNWHHVAVTFKDATNILNIYVDGALVTTVTKSLEADVTGHVVTLGNMLGNNPFSGLLDEVRVYSRALTPAEIQADRTTPIVP